MNPRVLEGRYDLGELLGQGGMAAVYRATDLRLRRPVAIKLLHPQYGSSPEFVERFQREARAAALLSHPNIISVHDVGEDGGTRFIVMEYVEGESLKQLIEREGPLGPDSILRFGIQIAGALEYSHSRGVLHRDVKPQNILVDRDGLVKVADFGIAAALGAASLTPAGSVMGTPQYLSPEQARGEEGTAASDLYSAGVVLYEMAAGRPPFQAGSPLATARMHAERQLPPLAELNPKIPAGLQKIIARALEKDPRRRYRDAGDLAVALREYEAESLGPTRRHFLDRSRPPEPPPRRFPAPVFAPVAIAIGALLLFLVAAGAALQAVTTDMAIQRNATAQAAQATTQAAQAMETAQAIQVTLTAIAGAGPAATAGAQALDATRTRVAATAESAQATVFALETMAPVATAEAQALASARSVQGTVVAGIAGTQRVYALEDGRLDLREDVVARVPLTDGPIFPRSVPLRNFMVGVRFHNPFDPSEHPWDYGVGFRSAAANEGYRLYVDSRGDWHFELSSGAAAGGVRVDPLKSGKAPGLRTARNGSNYLSLLVRGAEALFLVNGDYVATLDASDKDIAGEVWLGSGFARANSLAGRSTRYQDFRVWALP